MEQVHTIHWYVTPCRHAHWLGAGFDLEIAAKTQHMSHAKRREFITHKAIEINNQVIRGLPKKFAQKLVKLKVGVC